ncbi:GGDEF domain-containing protein [Acetobacteraceae bacterium KSS8]|uniref:GGDEF domain-containing protein n=1 Tax=Endosaccharibacter trunci TaxID=2812733 RepID=A0ABT1W2Q8_9PROT|nr:GGDEF domain-containing protein [Acetobacteraceae bacterium KSS8]
MMDAPPRKGRKVSSDIYKVLVGDLAFSTVPTTIMGVTLVLICLVVGGIEGEWFLLAIACGSVLGMTGKLTIMARQRRLIRKETVTFFQARLFATQHFMATQLTAICVAGTSWWIFVYCSNEWHMLAAALLFAYGSGVVGRLSVLPMLAIPALVVATVPGIITCAMDNDIPHRLSSLIFVVFLLGSFETVRHLHRRAVRHITMELDMATLARKDSLTGLLNRLGFREALRSRSVRPSDRLVIHCLDLDGFKAVNDQLGHAAGDDLLVQVAHRIRTLSDDIVVGRLGGDEFAILQTGLTRPQDASALASRIVEALSQPFVLDGRAVSISCSLGFAVDRAGNADFDIMLRDADAASYTVKRAGGGAAMASQPRP